MLIPAPRCLLEEVAFRLVSTTVQESCLKRSLEAVSSQCVFFGQEPKSLLLREGPGSSTLPDEDPSFGRACYLLSHLGIASILGTARLAAAKRLEESRVKFGGFLSSTLKHPSRCL